MDCRLAPKAQKKTKVLLNKGKVHAKPHVAGW